MARASLNISARVTTSSIYFLWEVYKLHRFDNKSATRKKHDDRGNVVYVLCTHRVLYLYNDISISIKIPIYNT